eukprot:CAMPEP_0115585454 /NCGR_PEP_ID=MMETSP0272-20121206/7202_1 /TAXON_ID=71861 /ORGANISM="Scrippsiella trochoidea, Strain CCMP3099" /LENGTH=131 /DNA_ID=CAMNT_0003020509 /DNA_START=41 /DNA_END=433 /DNA_ORIENTATION=-
MAAWSVRYRLWVRYAPSLPRAPQTHTQRCTTQIACCFEFGCALLKFDFSAARRTVGHEVIPIFDLEDEFGCTRMKVLRPCLSLNSSSPVLRATNDEDWHDSGELCWKRFLMKKIAIIWAKCDYTLERLILQ